MKVELVDYTMNPVQKIGRAASICYKGKTDLESNVKRAKHCQESGHLTVNRFASATFLISGISRVCSHQLVRTAHAGFLQESQRYVEQTDIDFALPKSLEELGESLDDFVAEYLDAAKKLYAQMIDHGIKKEDARYILPQACTTSIYMTGNFQMWRHFLKERTAKAAQAEIREVALEIQKQLAEIAPEVFG